MIEQFVIENLSAVGPGTWVDGLEGKARRKGFKVMDLRHKIHELTINGTVERIGQYLWLKKGATECKNRIQRRR